MMGEKRVSVRLRLFSRVLPIDIFFFSILVPIFQPSMGPGPHSEVNLNFDHFWIFRFFDPLKVDFGGFLGVAVPFVPGPYLSVERLENSRKRT